MILDILLGTLVGLAFLAVSIVIAAIICFIIER